MVAEAEARARPPEPRAWSGRPGAAGAERTLSPGSRGRAPPRRLHPGLPAARAMSRWVWCSVAAVLGA